MTLTVQENRVSRGQSKALVYQLIDLLDSMYWCPRAIIRQGLMIKLFGVAVESGGQ